MNYTWAHSLDNSSDDVTYGTAVVSGSNDYSSSNFDARHSFSGAITYRIPAASDSGPLSLITKDWSLNAIVVARSGLRFNGLIFVTTPVLGYAYTRPDVVPGQPYWISNSAAAGSKSLNPAAFSVPPTDPDDNPLRQGTEGRNDISGFGLTQIDFSISRKFSIMERFNLQFRADAFNLFNHPNFANPTFYIQYGPYYLQTHQMLNQNLGGLNPLFQQGGPRSLQLSLRLSF